jgi:hypothetical protein
LEISTPIPLSSATSRSVVTWPWACATSRKRRSSGPKPPTIPAGKAASTVSPAGVSQRSRRKRTTSADTRSSRTRMSS